MNDHFYGGEEDEKLEPNTGRFSRLHLRVSYQCSPGQTVHVSGSSFAAGQANPQAALEMVTTPGEELAMFEVAIDVVVHWGYLYACRGICLWSLWCAAF